MRKIIYLLIPIITFLIIYSIWNVFGPVGNSGKSEVFVVPQNQESFNLSQSLYDQKLIRNKKVFEFLLNNFSGGFSVKPGGYRLSNNMNAWQVMKKITSKFDLAWVSINYCLRREQIGEILAEDLSWSNNQLEEWNSSYTNLKPEYFEGVYYPDTYLLPLDESGLQIAERFINRFNEKIALLSADINDKNIKWTTALKIASLIAREAAGTKDMKLISGIIWNRLDSGMPLQIDSTMQYTLGKNESGKWWGPVDLTEKKSDSPYNSYLTKGLPPTPICSPNIDAIEAAINPEQTDCLFYLHDTYKEIHCAVTYTEHLANIKKYLNY